MTGGRRAAPRFAISPARAEDDHSVSISAISYSFKTHLPTMSKLCAPVFLSRPRWHRPGAARVESGLAHQAARSFIGNLRRVARPARARLTAR
jgi:hypothetical protein